MLLKVVHTNLLLLCGVLLFSQDGPTFTEHLMMVHKGHRAYSSGNFQKAEHLYTTLLESKWNAKAAINMAHIYRMKREYIKARDLYKLLYEQSTEKYPEALYYYALVSLNLNDVYMAKRSLELFIREAKKSKPHKNLVKIARQKLDVLEKEMPEIMQSNIELSPTPPYTGNKYISYDSLGQAYLLDNSLKLKRSNIVGSPGNPVSIKKNDIIYKTSDFYEQPLYWRGAFMPDSSRYYFLIQDEKYNWALFYLLLSDTLHKRDIAFYDDQLNLQKSNIGSFNFGKNPVNGRIIIYFSSNRPGGKGGYDLWYSEFNPRYETFKEPKNLGTKINSSANELSPNYINEDQTLYFSSDGIHSIGGYDILMSRGAGRKWESPEVLPKPFNSPYDDYFPFYYNDTLFFLSNRQEFENAHKKDFVFNIRYEQLVNREVPLQAFILLPDYLETENFFNQDWVFVDVDKADKRIMVKEVDKENESLFIKNLHLGNDTSFSLKLDDRKTYDILAFSNRIKTDSIRINADGFENKTLHVQFADSLPNKLIYTVHYELNQARLTDNARDLIDSILIPLLNKYPYSHIEVIAHTDSIGSYKYNMLLSRRRARNAWQYLITKGVLPDQLSYKGLGYTSPGKFINAQDRSIWRRTEFVIQLND